MRICAHLLIVVRILTSVNAVQQIPGTVSLFNPPSKVLACGIVVGSRDAVAAVSPSYFGELYIVGRC